jgi:hypothetical protein
MGVYRFAKVPPQANDRTRRYRVLQGEAHVGEVEVGGNAPDGDAMALTVTCHQALSDEIRAEVLAAARQFMDELAAGWGVQLAEVPGGGGWAEQPDGVSRTRLEFLVV